MKERWLLVVLVLVGLFALTTTLGPRRPIRPGQRLMREKSQVSQQLFTAFVRQDFSLLSTQAQRLAVLDQSASWPPAVATNTALSEQREQLRQRAEALSQTAATNHWEAMQNAFIALIGSMASEISPSEGSRDERAARQFGFGHNSLPRSSRRRASATRTQ